MATCSSLSKLFDTPAPENATWGQINALKPVDAATFTDIFGELHFQEKPPPTPAPAKLDRNASLDPPPGGIKPGGNGSGGGFSKSSESLQLCTEGLGFESSVDVDDEESSEGGGGGEGGGAARVPRSVSDVRQRGGVFPPPITSMGRSGVCFRSYREDGRFVLREIRVPTHEFLHASREDGRLKLHFVHSNEEEQQGEQEEQVVKGDDEK